MLPGNILHSHWVNFSSSAKMSGLEKLDIPLFPSYTFLLLLLLLFRRAAAVTNCQASSRQAGRGRATEAAEAVNQATEETN